MISVRLRLLVLALTPFILLMPFLLFVGMARWTSDYDKLLIGNVESDLRIAQQYLSRLMSGTGNDLTGIAESSEFARVLRVTSGGTSDAAYFARKRRELDLDFLYFLPEGEAAEAASRWPVIASGLAGWPQTAIDVFPEDVLRTLSGNLARRARIDLIETEAAVPTDREVEDRGMVVHAASPVIVPGHEGVLVGGILLNSNLDFIDAINKLVYLNPVTGGERQGTATLFLEDVRVSTNVRLFEDVRALGTRVSAEVRRAVLDEGRTWLARAFVVNDWYISGYLPLVDSFGQRVGMLYVGFLEAPFIAKKRDAYEWMIGAFALVLAISVPAFLWLAKGIFAPLETMTGTMRRVGEGDLAARNALVNDRDEIGQVAAHLDNLLDQLQERDLRLRAWADHLNDRVDQRTLELREVNEKLEETYRQLVMSEKLASIGEITAGVAHEINNPLAVIQGNVDVIREILGPEVAPLRTELDLIDRQVSRMEAIVGKLLKFARPREYADYESAISPVPVVEDCLLLLDHTLSKGDVEVVRSFGDVPNVRIDPGEFQQVIINLVVNAAHAMGDAGRLEIGLLLEEREGRAGVCLSVRDHGPGIPEDKIGAVFDPFFTTKRAEGTGLGLSISQNLIQQAGGMISARNHPEGGAEFRVWLPAADAAEDVAAQ